MRSPESQSCFPERGSPTRSGRLSATRFLAVQEFPPDIDCLRAQIVSDAIGRIFHLAHESREVITGTGNSGDANGSRLPGDGLVHFGDRDIEAMAELFLEAADDLAAILERLRVLNAQLDGHAGDGHVGSIVNVSTDRALVQAI